MPDDYAGDTSTTGTVAVGGSRTATVEVAGDTDWLRITLQAGYTYTFDMLGAATGDGTLADPYMRIRDSAGNSLIPDDDSGSGLNARIIDFTASYTGIYYISAGSSTASGTGTYTVQATQTGTPSISVDPETSISNAMPIIYLPFLGIGEAGVNARILQGFGQHGYVVGGKDGTGYWSMDVSGSLYTEDVVAGASGTIFSIQFGQPETSLVASDTSGFSLMTNDQSPGRLGNYVTIKINDNTNEIAKEIKYCLKKPLVTVICSDISNPPKIALIPFVINKIDKIKPEESNPW